MKQTSVIRITAGICFCFSVLNVFSAFHVWRLPMALFTAACLLLGLVIVRCGSPALRLVLSLLPAVCFLPGPFSPLLILPGLIWFWYVLTMCRENYAMPLEDYRRIYTFMLAAGLFFIAANIAHSTIYSGQLISVDSLVYLAVFLVLGVLAMRRMQMGAEMSRKWQLRNLMSVIGFPLLAVGAAVILFLVLRFSQQALAVILTPVGKFFIWLFSRLFPTGHSPIEELTLEEFFKRNTAVVQPLEFESGAGNTEMPDIGTPSGILLIERAAGIGAWILLGILLLGVLILIWNRTKREKLPVEEALLYEETEAVPSGKHGRRRGLLPAGNARQLRRIYKTYLEYRSSKGLSVLPSDTSAEILERDRAADESGDAARLRELYIAARYGAPSAVSRAQVQEAQACLERIVG